MRMNQRMLSVLEYDKIISRLSEYCATEGAKARARSLMPDDDFDTVILRQRRTEDARRLIDHKGYPTFSAPESTTSSTDAGKSLCISVC